MDPTHNDIEGEIVSASKTRYKVETLDFDDGVVPMGPIGTNYLTLTVTVTRIQDAGFDRFQLYSFFRWDTEPFFRLSDGIALAWSDDFTLINSSITLYYEGLAFTGYNNSKGYLRGTAPEAGVGYGFPMSYSVPGPGITFSTSLKYGAIRAQIRKHNSTGGANVVVKYVHSKLSLSGPTFTFEKTPAIGFTIFGTSDEMENYTHWVY